MRSFRHNFQDRISKTKVKYSFKDAKSRRLQISNFISANREQLENNTPEGLIPVFIEILNEVISGLLTNFTVSFKLKSENFEQELNQITNEITQIKTIDEAILAITLSLYGKPSTLYVTSFHDKFAEALNEWEVAIRKIKITKKVRIENILLVCSLANKMADIYFLENNEEIRISFKNDKLSVSLGSNSEISVSSPHFIAELSDIEDKADEKQPVKLDTKIQICKNPKLQKLIQKQKHLIQKKIKSQYKEPFLYPKNLLGLMNEKPEEETLNEELREKICSFLQKSAADCKEYYLVRKKLNTLSQNIKQAFNSRMKTQQLLINFSNKEPDKEKIINNLISFVKDKPFISEEKFDETIAKIEKEIANLDDSMLESKEEDLEDNNNKTSINVDIYTRFEQFFTEELAKDFRKQFSQNSKYIFKLLLKVYVRDQQEKYLTGLHGTCAIDEWRPAEKKLNATLIPEIKDLLLNFSKEFDVKELIKKELEEFKLYKKEKTSEKKGKQGLVELEDQKKSKVTNKVEEENQDNSSKLYRSNTL